MSKKCEENRCNIKHCRKDKEYKYDIRCPVCDVCLCTICEYRRMNKNDYLGFCEVCKGCTKVPTIYCAILKKKLLDEC